MRKFFMPGYRYVLLILIGIILLCSSVLASIVENCTVVTKSGERYEDVTATVNHQYKTVAIQLEDSKKNISFTQIETILDAQGNNITPELLDGHYSPKKEEWRSERDEFVKASKKKLWNLGLRLGINYSFPVGTYYEGMNSGIGFEGDFLIAVNHYIAIRGIVSKSGMKWDDNYGLISLDPGVTIIDQDWTMNAMRYVLAGQYYNRPKKNSGGKTIWYAYSGLGVISHKLTGDLSVRDNSDNSIENISESDTQTKFVTTFGGGAIFLTSNNFGIDLSACMDVVYIGSDPNQDSYGLYGNVQTALILDIKLALIMLFN